MPNRIRSRFTVALSAFAILAASLVPAFPAAAEEPPAPDPIITSEPSESPEPEATPTSEPTPEATPSAEPTPVDSPSAAPTATPTPSASADPASTVQYSGTAQQLASDGLAADDDTVLFGVTGQGYLNVDISGLASRPDATNPVTLTLKVPAGLTLSSDPDTRFTQLANAGASSPLIATASSKVKQTEPRETAALVNTTPNIPSVHHVFAVYVSPTNKKVKDASQGNNTAANAMVTAADTYWGLQSGGTIDFVLDGVVPWYQSTYSCSTSAGSTALWNQAMTKAKAAGFVPGKNMHLLLLMPENNFTTVPNGYCGGAIGLGTIGGSVNQGGLTWVMGSTSDLAKTTVSHEFGHNMSLGHADVLACLSATPVFNASTLNYPSGNIRGSIDNCTIEDYEDITDVMGFGLGDPDGAGPQESFGTGGALSSPQAIRAGIWTSSAYSIAPVAVDTPYTLQPVSGHSGVRAVVVQDNDGQSYFVEYRNGTNEDLPPKTAGCNTNACVLSVPNVRILRFEPQGYQGYPGYDSLVIGRSNTNIGFTAAGTFWSGGSVNQGVKIEVVSLGATASIKVTRTAHTTTEDWVVVKTTVAYDSKLRVGDTLTAFLGDYWDAASYTFQWTRDGVNIPSSNVQNYTLTKDDLGKHIDVQVTSSPLPPCLCSVLGYFGPSPAVLAGIYQPTDPGPVTVDASTSPLQTVTPVGGAGNWPTGTTFTYQWYKGATASTVTTAIAGQTTSQYSPAAGDTFLRVRVTASVPGYSPAVRYSTAADYAIKNTSLPALGGIPKVGTQLTASFSPTFTNAGGGALAGVTSTYQWLRNGVPISDNPAATLDATDDLDYTLRSLDYNAKVTLRIISTKPGYAPNTVVSAPLTITQKGTIQATSPTATMVTDIDAVNTFRLLAQTTGVTETDTTASWQWYRVNITSGVATAITGATLSAYRPVAADYAYKLRVVVTVKKTNYDNLPLIAVARDFSLRIDPTTPLGFGASVVQVENTVTGNTPTWKIELPNGSMANLTFGSPDFTAAYQWRAAGVSLGAPGAAWSYFTNASTLGKVLSYTVTARYPGYLAYTATSPNTVPVAASPFSTNQLPMVGGSGLTRTVTAAFSDVAPSATSLKYQWFRDGVAIAGKTTASYLLVAADYGKTVTVKVSYLRAGYTTLPLPGDLSGATGKYWLRADSVLPQIIGTPNINGTLEIAPRQYFDESNGGETLLDGDVTKVYQWYRSGVAIAGATDETYILDAPDKGKTITVRVTASVPTRTHLLPSIATSAPTQAIGTHLLLGWDDPETTTLNWGTTASTTPFFPEYTALEDGIIDELGTTTAYQWFRENPTTHVATAIPGATKRVYLATQADRGYELWVRVTVSKKASGAVSWTPVVMNSLKHNQTLGADPGPVVHIYTSLTTGALLAPQVPIYRFPTGGAVTITEPQKYQWYRNGVAITAAQGGIASEYVLKSADVGAKMSVRVTTGWQSLIPHIATYTTAPATLKVLKGTLLGTAVAPTVSMSAPATNTLLATPPSVTGTVEGGSAPATFTYQWLRNGAAISKATASTFKLTSADSGKNISVRVTANLVGYNSVTLPASTPLNYNIKVIVGSEPYASIGDWVTGATPSVYGENFETKDGALASPTIKYQWLRSGVAITGAINNSYMLQAADVGKLISARLTVSAPGYLPLVFTTPAQLAGLATTTDSGAAQVGVTEPSTNTLTASIVPGSLLPANPPPMIAYQWQRDGVAIAGATASSYKLTAADWGTDTRVRMIMTRPGFTNPNLPEIFSVGIDYSIDTVDTPAIDDATPQVGQTLSVADIDYTTKDDPVSAPVTRTYQWYRAGVAIVGATSQQYFPTYLDENKAITVRVTASLGGYIAKAITTAPTGATAKGVFTGTFVSPDVSVSPANLLSVALHSGSVNSPSSPTLSYVWLRDGNPMVPAVTTPTYGLKAADWDHDVSVRVTVSKPGYISELLDDSAPLDYSIKPDNPPNLNSSSQVGQTFFATLPVNYTSKDGTVPFPTEAFQWFRAGVAIPGATSNGYTAVAADLGKVLTWRMTVSKPGYIPYVVSLSTAPVALGSLGSPVVNVATTNTAPFTLTATLTGLTQPGVTITYQWYRYPSGNINAKSKIVGATTATYKPVSPADYNQLITVEIKASKSGFTSYTSPLGNWHNYSIIPLGVPILNDLDPVLGETIGISSIPSWTIGESGGTPGFTYQWLRNGVAIAGATAATYGPVIAADRGATLAVRVTGSTPGYLAGNATSPSTAMVPKLLTGSFVKPVVTKPAGGLTLTATIPAGAITTTGTTLEYQWLRDGVDIPGGVNIMYDLIPADFNKLISVRITVSKTDYESRVMPDSTGINYSVVPAGLPVISDLTPEVGDVLSYTDTTYTAGGATHVPPGDQYIQWRVDGVDVAGTPTYTVQAADDGKAITIRVDTPKAGFITAVLLSAPTALVTTP